MPDNNLPTKFDEIYYNLREQVKAVITETKFAVSMDKLKGKWMIGQTVVEEGPPREYGDQTVKKLASDLNVSERDLYYCIKFYEEFPALLESPQDEPDMEQIGDTDGKMVTWTKVKNKYLEGENPCDHTETKVKVRKRRVCKSCGKVLESELIEERES